MRYLLLTAVFIALGYHREFDIRKHGIFVKIQGPKTAVCYSGLPLNLQANIANRSDYSLQSSMSPKKPRVNLSYRIPETQHEGRRTFFIPPIQNNSLRQVNLHIKCPEPRPAPYLVQVELVEEGRAWQNDVAPAATLKLQLKSKDLGAASSSTPSNHGGQLCWPPWLDGVRKSPKIYQAAHIAYQILNSSSRYLNSAGKRYLLSEAGSQYPMIWVRDMQSIQTAYDILRCDKTQRQHHWAELFLDQSPIPDWISWDKKSQGRNSVQSDQELWLMLSFLDALKTGTLNSSWFQQYENQIHHLWEDLIHRRFDQKMGCLWNGHTIGWGDVGLLGADSHTSTKIEYAGGTVCSAFLQGLLIKVAKEYAPLLTGLRKKGVQEILALSQNFLHSLWLEAGFFRMHQHRHMEIKHPALETEQEVSQFALAAQVMPWLAGEVNSEKLRRIIINLEKYQKKYRVSTIGGVLLPAYPLNLFANPILAKPYTYQNGGQWDWWGGRGVEMLSALEPAKAWQALRQIAIKVVKNGSFYEWEHLDGSPGAGIHFRAGAASYIKALANLLQKEGKQYVMD